MSSRRPSDALIFALLLLTFLIWSNTFLAIGELRKAVSAMDLVLLRFLPVGLISMGIVLVRYRRESMEILRAHPLRVLTSGGLVVIAYNLSLNGGMGYVTPSASSLLIALNPLFTLLLAAVFLGERLTTRRVTGTMVSFTGLAVVVLFGRVGVDAAATLAPDKIPYALLVLVAPLSWATNTIVTKPVVEKHSPVAYNYLSLTLGSLPLLTLVNRHFLGVVSGLSVSQWGSVAFLVLPSTILAFALWIVALRYWRASTASLFVYLNPPLTALFAWMLLGQGITPLFSLGGLVMLGGVLLATAPTSLFRRSEVGPTSGAQV